MSTLTADAVAELITAALTDERPRLWEQRHIALINARQRQLGMTSAALSRTPHIPRNALTRILHGHKTPTLTQVADLCQALDLRLTMPTVDRPGR